MRLWIVACVLAAFVGCDHEPNPGPSLTIVPSAEVGPLAVAGPTAFDAILINSTAEVTWTVTGNGTLSGTTGLHVVYAPPVGTATATLTASTSDGLTASVELESGPVTLTAGTIPGLQATATVTYDAQEIPHIRCETKVDCFMVQGYVHAHDRLFPMDFLRHVARARLAELIGIDGLAQDVQLRTLFITRAGHRIEDDLVAAMDPDTAALLAAYARGVNAFLRDLRSNAAVMPGEYAQLPFPPAAADIADWTAQDTWAMARLQQFQLSETLSQESAFGQFAAVYTQGPLADLGKFDAWIRAAAPPSERAHTLSPGPLQASAAPARSVRPGNLAPWHSALAQTTARFDALTEQLRPINATVGSNNWVVAGSKSATGKAMVANDPHLALQYPPLFHLSTMTSALESDNLDLAGGAFPGIPGALVGRGKHVGWGVTVVGYDVTDLYLEQFLPQGNCPNAAPCVLFKGVPTATLPVPQTFLVRTAAGLVDASTLGLASPPPAVVLVVPHHGPIIQAPDAGGRAVSVRWTGQEGNTQDLKAILGLNTATDVDAAILALQDFATGAQNFVLADDQGHIAYDPHALVPVRQFADIAIRGAGVIPPWFPLPGDGTAEWGDGTSNCASATATPVPATCWLASSALPQGKDPAKGYFLTANADPTSPSVSDDNNPLAHPPYLSFGWDDSTGFRATQIEARLEAAIADGGTVSLAEMESIQADHVSRPGKAFAPTIAALPDTNPTVVAAKAVFAKWQAQGFDCPTGLTGVDPAGPADTTAAVVDASAGCFLFHAFIRSLFTRVFADDLRLAGQGVNQLQAMKAMLHMLSLDPGNVATPAKTRFCNDVSATGTVVAARTCQDPVAIALAAAFTTLSTQVGADPSSWVWGRAHTMQPVSLLALITTNFRPGPFARPGGAFTVDVATPSTSAAGVAFPFTSSGNVRHISVMDTTKAVVRMQLPGPVRDIPTLVKDPDLLSLWLRNTYFDFAFGAQIDAVAVSSQTFTAH
jgi:penicillin G amidase